MRFDVFCFDSFNFSFNAVDYLVDFNDLNVFEIEVILAENVLFVLDCGVEYFVEFFDFSRVEDK